MVLYGELSLQMTCSCGSHEYVWLSYVSIAAWRQFLDGGQEPRPYLTNISEFDYTNRDTGSWF